MHQVGFSLHNCIDMHGQHNIKFRNFGLKTEKVIFVLNIYTYNIPSIFMIDENENDTSGKYTTCDWN